MHIVLNPRIFIGHSSLDDNKLTLCLGSGIGRDNVYVHSVGNLEPVLCSQIPVLVAKRTRVPYRIDVFTGNIVDLDLALLRQIRKHEPREKERMKYGLAKRRKRFQFSKR